MPVLNCCFACLGGFGLRYKIVLLLTPLLIASAACALMADTGVKDNRPVLEASRPSVVWLAPAANSQFASGAEILLLAQARDLGAGVARIEFYDTFDTLIDTLEADDSAGVPFLQGAVRWRPIEVQRHFVKVRAFRADGISSSQREISIEVVDAGDVPLARPTATQQPESASDRPVVTESAEIVPTQAAPIEALAETPNTPEPAAAVPVQARVLVESLNVRVAPRIDAAMASNALTVNTVITLVGHNDNGEWYAMQLPSGSVAWVFARSLEIIQGDAETLPLVATP